MSLEQDYYDFLTRTDHPVFRRDFSFPESKEAPFNSILNALIAKQLVRMRASLEVFKADRLPHTVTLGGINTWENRFFGFTKGNVLLADRREQLKNRINGRVGLSVQDVLNAAISFTGKTPKVYRNSLFEGWVLDQSALGLDTFLNPNDTTDARQTYVVMFYEPIPPATLDLLDKELTKIEKGGSRHFITAPLSYWVLGNANLDKDTILK